MPIRLRRVPELILVILLKLTLETDYGFSYTITHENLFPFGTKNIHFIKINEPFIKIFSNINLVSL
jgi:hypothetical protein